MKIEKQKFYVCKHCGNMVGFIHNAGVPMMCCGQKMDVLAANTTEAATEKHVPAIKMEGKKVIVSVGSVAHPMTEEHYNPWVYIQTAKGGQRKPLMPADKPEVEFILTEDDELEIVFAYCNLHGLWKADYEG